MQGILISLATAVTLAILAAFAAPLVVDWNAWRGTFEREIARTLGIPVVIRGSIEAEILPAPRLTLTDVTLGDVVSTGGTVREFEAELSLGALMRGEVEATGVTLVEPRMRIVIDSNGRIALPTGAGRPAELGVARLEVRDGSLDLLDRASDQTVTLDDIDLTGEARALSGPFKLDGEVAASGARFSVRATLGKVDDAGSGKLRLVLDGRTRPYKVDLDGALSAADGVPGFDGRASLIRKGAGGLESWQLSGHLKASPAQVLADSLELALGGEATPAQLAGAARLTLGRAIGLDVVLNARSLDLDALGASGGAATDGTSPAVRPAEALARGARLLAELPAPDIASRIGVSAEQLMLGGTVVRDVRLDITGSHAGWRIDTAEAQFPGKATLKASGAPEAGGFSGNLSLAAEDPAAFLRWAAPDAARDLAASASGPARLATRLKLSAGALALDNLNAAFGDSRLTGSISAALPDSGGPKLDMSLAMDGFALDPLVAALQRAATAVGGGADASLKLDGRNLTVAGQPLGRLVLDAAATGGSWRVKRMVMDDLAGLHLEGAGWMENFSTTPRGEFNLTMSGTKADGLVPVAALVAGPETAEVVARLVPVAAPVKLSTAVVWGEAGGRSITSTGSLGRITGEAAFTRSTAGVPLAVSLTADAADGAAVLGALGIGGLSPRLGAVHGTFSLSPLTQGEGDVRAALTATGVNLTAEGKARLVNGAFVPQLAVRADGADIGRLLPQVAAAAGNAPVPAALAFALSRADGSWQAANLEGSLGGAPLAGALALEPGGVPRLTGHLSFDTLSAPALVGLFGARAAEPTAGPSAPTWSNARFLPNPVNGVALGVDLEAGRLALIGPYVLEQGKLRLASDGTGVELRDISGAFGGGRVGGRIEVRRRADDMVEAEGRLLLDKVDMAALAAPTGARTPPGGRVSLSLDLGGSGRTPVQLVQALSGQGTIAVQNLGVPDADPAALAGVLAEAESLSPPPDERHTALMFDRALMRGPLAVPVAESTLSVVGGVVRLSPARAQAGDTRLAFSGSLDLARLLVETAIDYEGPGQGGAAPTATLAWRGTLAAPDRRVSATGLTGVIAMRAIERETRRLEEQHGGAPAPTAPAAAPAPATPAPAAQTAPVPPPATALRPAAPPPPANPTPAAPTVPTPPPAAAPLPAVQPPPATPAPATPAPAVQPPPAPATALRPAAPPAAATPPAPARPAAPATAQPARPAPRRADGVIERQELPPPLPTPFGAATGAPAAGAATTSAPAAEPTRSPVAVSAPAAPAPEAVRPSAAPAPHRAPPQQAAPPSSAQARPRPAATAQPAAQRPPANVARPPLPLEPTLPPTRGFGDLPRPPGLVGE
ncbi:AsmA-like C-terminal region-containing protein [Xanthobacter sp. V0B-10]|uniref:AsmA family protein n=1 Tax=Xanthobacter albus TaxID=3119929 RepID=UPI003729F872